MNAQAIASSSTQSKATVVFVCILAALAGLMFGLDVGVISGATQFIQAEFKVSDHTIEWIVSSMMAGAAIGALGAGWMSASLGRKRSLIFAGIVFIAGSLFCAVAWSPAILIVARLVLGVAIGVHLHRAAVSRGSSAGKDSRRDDLHLPADDHHGHPAGLPFRHGLQRQR